ncbi:hypothetical protein N0V93_002111 [Gnomoniopsis smithogilvyi]|uniref:Uncharacterized protein n=1 Tax=Gnomoniopsis smithogilvyi TaxID=1191159 RepID=A0A9W8Z6U3_9PEZI|nr:hypothetical protein N0V93_002111 [Gnomoniopsis smithogilvyi]
MHSSIKFAFTDEVIQFLSQEWSYARLKPINSPILSDDRVVPTTTEDDRAINSECSEKMAAKPSSPQLEPTNNAHTTIALRVPVPVPELILPSDTILYDPKEFYKTGCIMAMLLDEEQSAAPTPQAQDLIVNTKTAWKGSDEEKQRAKMAAHRARVKSGAVACEGLAASR